MSFMASRLLPVNINEVNGAAVTNGLPIDDTTPIDFNIAQVNGVATTNGVPIDDTTPIQVSVTNQADEGTQTWERLVAATVLKNQAAVTTVAGTSITSGNTFKLKKVKVRSDVAMAVDVIWNANGVETVIDTILTGYQGGSFDSDYEGDEITFVSAGASHQIEFDVTNLDKNDDSDCIIHVSYQDIAP